MNKLSGNRNRNANGRAVFGALLDASTSRQLRPEDASYSSYIWEWTAVSSNPPKWRFTGCITMIGDSRLLNFRAHSSSEQSALLW
jgi:hypothetical protein